MVQPSAGQPLGDSVTTARRRVRDKVSEGMTSLDEARLAIGSLLGFYRRIRKSSQKELAAKASIKPSAVAMFESGRRLPSAEAIAGLAVALELDPLQKRQLEVLAEYPKRATVPGDDWFLPIDVIAGIPVFMRSLTNESEFQSKAPIGEMWIVTNRPLALEGEMYGMLKERIAKGKTSFVYFMDSTAGESPFQALWRNLASESRHLRRVATERLKCVLTPTSLCFQHFAICNPGGELGVMFGRLILYFNRVPVGFVAMDPSQVTRIYHLLDPIYRRCTASAGRAVATEYGSFRLLKPEIKGSDKEGTGD
jgi:transcriptional regulator with XRE-family HTH domain